MKLYSLTITTILLKTASKHAGKKFLYNKNIIEENLNILCFSFSPLWSHRLAV